jgi:HD-GYP domain-containing protein (c-di-GMP phosphodiesterase class II)
MGLMRSHESGLLQHSLHVAKLVTDYTRFSGLSYDSSWSMIEGGLLHDIGKTQLPPALLVKPKALNDAEQRMMILHPGIGSKQFLPVVGDSSRKGNLRTLRISEGAWRACSVNWQA